MSKTYDYDLTVIGGGAAGLTVASGAAQLGVKTLLIEREPLLGGDCLHFGCVPSKTLIKSAQVRHAMKTAGRYGLPEPAAMPPVQYGKIAERIKSVIDTIQVHDSVERFEGLGVTVRFGQAEFVDDHSLTLDGETISSARFVIATGSSPASPPFKGIGSLDEGTLLTNREIFSLQKLPESMIVLGAGPIALEMAQAFSRLGTRVTVVQRSGQVLSREDKDMADVVMRRLWEEGVDIHLNATVREVRRSDSGGVTVDIEISSAGGADGEPAPTQSLTLNAEKLLSALGRAPNVFGMGLENTGVKFDNRGVQVDSRMRAGRSHIYAAGDVTGQWQFTHAAGYEGGIVVTNAVFRLPRKANYTNMPWATYTDPEIASVGLNEKRALEKGVSFTVYRESFADNDRAQAEGRGEGVLKLLVDHRGRPIGAQAVGPSAGEVINEWVAVLGGGVKLSTLAGAVHPYPTIGEINKRVAGKVLSEKIFSDRTRDILKKLFKYRG